MYFVIKYNISNVYFQQSLFLHLYLQLINPCVNVYCCYGIKWQPNFTLAATSAQQPIQSQFGIFKQNKPHLPTVTTLS